MRDWGEKVDYKDRKNRKIEIFIDECGPVINAIHQGKIIGQLKFEPYGDTIILAHAEVKPEFQQSGIGTKMLNEFSELTDNWLVPNSLWSSSTGHEYYLSMEGAALLSACTRKGIINECHKASY